MTLLLYLIFIFYLSWCILPDFPSAFSQTTPYHFYLVEIEKQHCDIPSWKHVFEAMPKSKEEFFFIDFIFSSQNTCRHTLEVLAFVVLKGERFKPLAFIAVPVSKGFRGFIKYLPSLCLRRRYVSHKGGKYKIFATFMSQPLYQSQKGAAAGSKNWQNSSTK